MLELSTNTFLLIKALHIISVIAWMAGLLYLPRLFVYHCKEDLGSKASETFKIMERRLMKAIMHPAMIASTLFGGILVAEFSDIAWTMGWLHAKILCVFGLIVTHFFLAQCVKNFAIDKNIRTENFYRIINEVPTLLMIGIVILAVIKPF